MADYIINGPLIAGDTGTSSVVKGNTTVGGASNTIAVSGESVNIGGDSSTKSLTGNGSVSLGGTAVTLTQSGVGSVTIGGSSLSTIIAGNGNVSIAAAGLVGSGTGDVNLVLIGGSGTTIQGSGSVAAGPSTLTKRYNPTNPKMYVMGSPVITKTGSSFSTPGTITAAAVSGGVIEFITTPGAYTLPTSSAICIELLDASLTSFTGTPRHSFSVSFYNNSGGVCTLATGTGQTLTNATSPITIANGETRTWNFIFITPTSILIEDLNPLTSVNLSNAGTTSLVNNGTSPNLATKGLVNGTGISFSTTATDVTITNAGVTSLSGTANKVSVSASTGAVTLSLPSNVTITNSLTVSGLTSDSFLYSDTAGLLATTTAPTNGQLLIGNTGNPPTIGTLTAGTAISVTNGAGSITIANTGVTSIAGTANQITLSAATGSVTVSLPSAVTITTSLTISGLTANSFLYSGTAKLLTSTTAPTNGQILIGSTGAAPVASTLTAGSGITVTNGAGTITIASSGTFSEPFYTSSSRAIISGNGNTITNVSATSGGGIFGGNATNVTIGASSGSVAIGGNSVTVTPTVSGLGCVLIGSHNPNGLTISGNGCAIMGSVANSCTLGGSGFAIVGSNLLSSTILTGFGCVIAGSTTFSGTLTGTGSSILGSSSSSTSITGTGCALVGGFSGSGTLAGQGNVIVGGLNNAMSVDGTGNVVISGVGSSSFNTNSANTAIVGSSACNYVVGGSSVGSVIIAGQSSLPTVNAIGAAVVGGFTLSGTTTGGGSLLVGGNNCAVTMAGTGSVAMGGRADTITITGDGCVAISASGTLGNAAGDSGNVLIGGSGTTVTATNNVVIGHSTVTQKFSPTATPTGPGPQTFIKANPIWGLSSTTTITASATPLTFAQIATGFLRCNAAANITLTFPTATALYNAFIDSTSATFGLNMTFDLNIINDSTTSTVLVAAGTGFVTRGTIAAMTIVTGATSSRICRIIFTSNTTGVLLLVA